MNSLEPLLFLPNSARSLFQPALPKMRSGYRYSIFLLELNESKILSCGVEMGRKGGAIR